MLRVTGCTGPKLNTVFWVTERSLCSLLNLFGKSRVIHFAARRGTKSNLSVLCIQGWNAGRTDRQGCGRPSTSPQWSDPGCFLGFPELSQCFFLHIPFLPKPWSRKDADMGAQNPFPFLTGHAANPHILASLAIRWVLMTEFWPMAIKWKWHTSSSHLPENNSHELLYFVSLSYLPPRFPGANGGLQVPWRWWNHIMEKAWVPKWLCGSEPLLHPANDWDTSKK